MSIKGILALFILGVAFLMGVTVLFGSWFTIDEGERGVVLRNGKVTGVAEPGLNFKLPIIDDVKELSVRTQKHRYDKMAVYSTDIQPAVMAVTVNYKIAAADVVAIYTRFGTGYVDRILTPAVLRYSKEVFGKYQAANIILHRDALSKAIEEVLAAAMKNDLIQIVSVQLEDIDFSDAYEHAIEAAMQAEAEVKKVRQQLERQKVEAEKTIVNAQAKKQATIEVATGESEAIRLRGVAEASAIRARGDALRENVKLVELITAERWNGTLPTTMLPTGGVPFIGVK